MTTTVGRYHDRVRVDRSDDGNVAWLIMEDGENPVNVFTPSMVDCMVDAVKDVDADCLVVRGDEHFCAGADLEMIEDTPRGTRSMVIDRIASSSNHLIRALRLYPAPVIAAVTGTAAGGGFGFALASDLIIMHEEATLNPAYTKLGLTPDAATPFYLTLTIGLYRTRELLFKSDSVSAAEARELGLVNECYDGTRSKFFDKVGNDAAELAAGPTGVYAQTKRLVDTVFEDALAPHLERERDSIKRISDSEVFDEGLMAFLEGRDPSWE